MPDAKDHIRRLRFPDHTKNGQVDWRGFKPTKADKGFGISLTGCKDEISTPEDVAAYRSVACKYGDGLIGLCYITDNDIAKVGCESQEDEVDGEYGHLHELLTSPEDETKCLTKDQCLRLAVAATRNGGIIDSDVP